MKKTLQNKALLSRGLQWISLMTPGQMGLPDDGPLDKINFVGGWILSILQARRGQMEWVS